MPINTEILGLFKYDVVQDANSTFNITSALNDNWDKLDKSITLTVHNMTSTYSLGDWVKDGDNIYKSLQSDNTGHATSETDWWEKVEFGGGVWGEITGDINNQTDLINQLTEANKKATWGSITGDINAQTDLINKINSNKIPVGIIVGYGKTTAPSGFLSCNGAAVSRTTYSALYSVIGTTYGAGNGSTTFNVPNFSSSRVIRSSSISIKGNGKTMGIIDGSGTVGVLANSASSGVIARDGYGATLPHNWTLSDTPFSNNKATFGLTTDANSSGITGTFTSSTINYFIKY